MSTPRRRLDRLDAAIPARWAYSSVRDGWLDTLTDAELETLERAMEALGRDRLPLDTDLTDLAPEDREATRRLLDRWHAWQVPEGTS